MKKLNQALAVIGKLPAKELMALTREINTIKLDMSFTSSGFDARHIASVDVDQAKRYGVGIVRSIAKRGDYCTFWNDCSARLQTSKQCIETRFPDLRCAWNNTLDSGGYKSSLWGCDPFIFQGYYAFQHEDSNMTTSHQLMVIIANGGHRLYSEDQQTLITPKRGDIMVLNIHKNHALFPCADKTAARCSQQPLKFYGVPFIPNIKSRTTTLTVNT